MFGKINTNSVLYIKALRLVKVRAEAMQYASEIEPGGMATVHIRPDSKLNFALKMARDWCQDKGIEKPVCAISNYLNPDSKVVAGHLEVSFDSIIFLMLTFL